MLLTLFDLLENSLRGGSTELYLTTAEELHICMYLFLLAGKCKWWEDNTLNHQSSNNARSWQWTVLGLNSRNLFKLSNIERPHA